MDVPVGHGTLTAAGGLLYDSDFVRRYVLRPEDSRPRRAGIHLTPPPPIHQHGGMGHAHREHQNPTPLPQSYPLPPPHTVLSSPCSALQTHPQPRAWGNHGGLQSEHSPRGSTNYRESFATPWQPRKTATSSQPLAVGQTGRNDTGVGEQRSFLGMWALGEALHHPGVVDRLCSRYWTREGGWVKMPRPPVPRNALPSLPVFIPSPQQTPGHRGQQTSRDLRLSS